MMPFDPETVGKDVLSNKDALRSKQEQYTDMMRSTLIECDTDDPFSTQQAMRNILVMRIYHQMSRIVKYTKVMDKIEDKLFEAIDRTIENLDFDANLMSSLNTLMVVHRDLQKDMIDSQKLLEPYLNFKELTYVDIPTQEVQISDTVNGHILDQDSRKRLREGAQEVLDAISVDM